MTLQEVPPGAVATLFAPERPGPLIQQHVAASGVGRCLADRRVDPRTGLAELPGGNVACRGEPVAVPGLRGLVEAPPRWRPALESVAPVAVWERIIAVLPDEARPRPRHAVRRLASTDVAGLAALDPSIAWISETWGGHAGLAASGAAWVAVADGRPVAVATAFFVGTQHEDIGVVTEPGIPRPRAVDVVRRRGRRRHPGPRAPPDLDDEPGEHAAAAPWPPGWASCTRATTSSTPSASRSRWTRRVLTGSRLPSTPCPRATPSTSPGSACTRRSPGSCSCAGSCGTPGWPSTTSPGARCWGCAASASTCSPASTTAAACTATSAWTAPGTSTGPAWPGGGRRTRRGRCWRRPSGWPSASPCTTWSCCRPTPRTASWGTSARICSTPTGATRTPPRRCAGSPHGATTSWGWCCWSSG